MDCDLWNLCAPLNGAALTGLLLVATLALKCSCFFKKKSNFQIFFFFFKCLSFKRASLVAYTVKNLPVMQETQVGFLGWDDPLEKEMATHSSVLAWRISGTERNLVVKSRTCLSD